MKDLKLLATSDTTQKCNTSVDMYKIKKLYF